MNLAFIPARCGSKSIKMKNIKLLCGKPLIYWSLAALENSKYIDIVYVATDCEEIKSSVKSFGFSKVKIYDRDPQNANDTASTESVMLEFINKYNFKPQDLFVLVQATSPFTQAKDFDNAFTQFINSDYDSLFSCVRIKRFFWTNDAKPLNYDYKNRPRRQDYDGLLLENGAFFINSIKNIQKYKNRICGKKFMYEMEHYTALEIDEEDDWVIAEHFMKKYIIKDR